jgi:hypothetical protein
MKYVLKKIEVVIDDSFEIGDYVGFRRFFPKHTGEIVAVSTQRSKHYIVKMSDGSLQQIYFLDMYLMPLERRVIVEKWKNWRKG